jgi:hypothetical protein
MGQRIGTILLAAGLALAATTVKAQPDWTVVPHCSGRLGLCGYLSRSLFIEVIPRRFERAMNFSEGLAAVGLDGRYGYIDKRGEMVIAPRFDLAGEFSQGLAEVALGDKVGVIDRDGNLVVPAMFRRAVPFTRDVVLAAEGVRRMPPGMVGDGVRGGPRDKIIR